MNALTWQETANELHSAVGVATGGEAPSAMTKPTVPPKSVLKT
jgi:hypothetical protein